MIQVILFSAFAGICGLGFGGLLAALLLRKRSSDTIICWLLSFAAGVMISIVCFRLIPEAFEYANMFISLLGIIFGIFIIMILNRVVDKMTETRKEKLEVHHTHEELFHESQFVAGRGSMMRSGVIMFLAIALHNIPEGIAIGAGGIHTFQLGVLLAIIIALHNIPEGAAVAAPLLVGGIKKWKVVILTALLGIPTLIGGIIGALIGNISEIAVAISLSVAGGAMLYVVFGEIMPQSIVMTKNRTASIVTLFGIIVGLIITRI